MSLPTFVVVICGVGVQTTDEPRVALQLLHPSADLFHLQVEWFENNYTLSSACTRSIYLLVTFYLIDTQSVVCHNNAVRRFEFIGFNLLNNVRHTGKGTTGDTSLLNVSVQ